MKALKRIVYLAAATAATAWLHSVGARAAAPTAELTYETFADVCLNHFPDAGAIDAAARARHLVSLDLSAKPLWRQQPSQFALAVEAAQAKNGEKYDRRVWRNRPDDAAMEVESFGHKDGPTCAVSSDAKARDVAKIFADRSEATRLVDEERHYHELLKSALFRLYQLHDQRYVAIMESPYDYDAGRPGIGVNITVMQEPCVHKYCDMLQMMATASAAEKMVAVSGTTAAAPLTAEIAYETFAEVCLANFPDTVAIDDAARERGWIRPITITADVWRRSADDDQVQIANSKSTCRVDAMISEDEARAILAARNKVQLVNEQVIPGTPPAEKTTVRIYKLDDGRYVMVNRGRYEPHRISMTLLGKDYVVR
jgi:hypothetical protein